EPDDDERDHPRLPELANSADRYLRADRRLRDSPQRRVAGAARRRGGVGAKASSRGAILVARTTGLQEMLNPCPGLGLFHPEVVQVADVGQEPQRDSRLENLVLRLKKSIAPFIGEIGLVLLQSGGDFLRGAEVE